ncbi:MAG: glycosyltransferase family 4 protein [Aeromicrobium sp.]
MSGRVIYVVRSWPRLSQTFIVNEVLALERRGADIEIFAMTRSGEPLAQPQVAAVRAPVNYLDDGEQSVPARFRDHVDLAVRAPGSYASTARYAWRNPDLSSGYATATTLKCLSHAVRIARHVRALRRQGIAVAHLHAHFMHDPALVGLLTSRLTGLPYSVTAHARDLYQIPGRSLTVRADGARALLTCCEHNMDYLRAELTASAFERTRMIRHGVELTRFSPDDSADRGDSGARLISVGRLVEKKGYPDLLHACALLARNGVRFSLVIYGDGPMRAQLEQLRDEQGLAGVVEFAGEHDSSVIVNALRSADVFVLTSFVTDDGDRDGVPNVVVEAMACGLPVIATAVGGIPEAVRHRSNGLLAEPHDVPTIASHLAELLGDTDTRRRFGKEARRTVELGFDVDAAARELSEVFGVTGASR